MHFQGDVRTSDASHDSCASEKVKRVYEVEVTLKKGVTDPEGENIKKTLNLLGYSVSSVSVGKVYRIGFSGNPSEVEQMATKLLANPIIHNYTVRDSDEG